MIPRILVPRELEDGARDVAREVVARALDGVFGLLQAQIMRRQSYAYAHEQAVFHDEMAKRLRAIRIVGRDRRVRRHQRLAVRWGARAKARDPRLASECGLFGEQVC